jgi:rhomboid protease GluP
MRFAMAILPRPQIFTIILLSANLFVFLLMWYSAGMSFRSLFSSSEAVLLAYGAKQNVYIDVQHQWWRFVTPMCVHINLPHLLINMYSLWVVGPFVEKLYGSARFVVFWVVTGVAGVVASYLTVIPPGQSLGPLGRFLFKVQDVPSAGASGALFGLVGVLFVFGIKFRHELPEGFKRAFGTGLLPVIFLNLFIGYLGRGFIDNAAHLGGLAAGAVLALTAGYHRPGERLGVDLTWRMLQILALGLVVVSFAKVAQHLGDAPLTVRVPSIAPVENADEPNPAFMDFLQAMTGGQETFAAALQGDTDALSKIGDTVKSLDSAPSIDAQADDLRRQLRALLLRVEQLRDPAVTPPADAEVRGRAILVDFNAWKKAYDRWLRTTGRALAGPT